MPVDADSVAQLVEEVLDSGRTPEEVCADSPHLLAAVRAQWELCGRVAGVLDDVLPSPAGGGRRWADEPPDRRIGTLLQRPSRPDQLPEVPGYALEAVLGRGGMGVVYRALDLRLRRRVALKMILSGEYASRDERARFLREARAVAALRHPHVVQVYDADEHDGRPYHTMELVEGGTLAARLHGTPLPPGDAAALLGPLADALQAAHEAGIVHRDLKPGNVLLDRDGTPKVADFGLARRTDAGDEAITLTGAGPGPGTPSYMAPEQVAGGRAAVGPAADVYALGAVLYEMLTGRPPFRGDSPAETARQVLHDEPAAPSRMNAKVPRDLETICLKCLCKEPQRRYASAAALADDLRRFLGGRPIQARPAGWGGRIWRWARREPAAAALTATAVALVALALGGGFLVQRQRAAARAATALQQQAIEAALAHAGQLTKLGHWPEARRALEGAPRLLGTSAPADLRERLHRARTDADIVVRLQDLRLRLSEGSPVHGGAAPAADRLYAEAFASYGITPAGTAADAAAVVKASAVRDILLVYLHDWLYWATAEDRDRLGDVLDLADHDPWRRAFRDARAGNDVRMLEELAGAPGATTQPPALLSGLGGTLLADGQPEVALTLLRAAQRRYPGDFWINYLLGHALEQDRPHEALGYFRAAVALRPGSDQANVRLSGVLHYLGDSDAAATALLQAVASNPSRAGIGALVKVLAPKGLLEDVRVIWEKMLERNPPDHDQWYGYAQLCVRLGKDDEYRRARDAMLRRFGQSDDWIIAERTSLACLLLPGSPDELQPAAAMADRALAAASNSPEPNNAYVQFAKGLAEYRIGRIDEAVPWLRDAVQKIPSRPGPRLVLAMAQFRSGSPTEARKSLAAAVAVYDWKQLPDDFPGVWTSHILRREAEAMILPNLPAFLQGRHQPQDNDERLALLAICHVQGLYGASARLYADAFEADPGLAAASTAECLRRAASEKERHDRINVLKIEPRYLAARCAALAGCGLGEDGLELNDAERTRWRTKAQEWLRADLAAWAKTLQSDSRASRDLAKEMLTLWLAEPDLARLREPGALANLPAAERAEWTALWGEVRLALENVRPR